MRAPAAARPSPPPAIPLLHRRSSPAPAAGMVVLPPDYDSTRAYPVVEILPATGSTAEHAPPDVSEPRGTRPALRRAAGATARRAAALPLSRTPATPAASSWSCWCAAAAASRLPSRGERGRERSSGTSDRCWPTSTGSRRCGAWTRRRLVLAGLSMGGDLAWAITLRNPDIIHGAIVMASRASYRPGADAARALALRGGRFFLTMGDADDATRRRLARAAAAMLDRLGVAYRFRMIAGAGHEPAPPAVFAEALDFVRRPLKQRPQEDLAAEHLDHHFTQFGVVGSSGDHRTQLVRGGLRSAEPRLGEPRGHRPPLGVGGGRLDRPPAGGRVAPPARTRSKVTAARLARVVGLVHDAAHLPVEPLHRRDRDASTTRRSSRGPARRGRAGSPASRAGPSPAERAAGWPTAPGPRCPPGPPAPPTPPARRSRPAVVQGVNGRSEGRSAIPADRVISSAASHVGARVPLVEVAQHEIAQRLDRRDDEGAPGRGESRATDRRCVEQVLDLRGEVEAEVRELRVHPPPRSSTACRGPFRKSGSVNVMCRAPAATCRRMSSSTTSGGTTKNRPPYTGGMGQCRHSCRQPRLVSTAPATRRSPSRSNAAYRASAGRPDAARHREVEARRRGAAARPAARRASRPRASATSCSSDSPPRTASAQRSRS